MIWFLGGINGTGKSTFASSAAVLEILGVREVVNPDAVAREIASKGLEYGLANLAAANITQGHTYDNAVTLNDTANFAIETVLSSAKFDPILLIAKQRGIGVGLVYIGVHSVNDALQRIKSRVAAGLHDVPEDSVRKRWANTHNSLERWAPQVDKLFVFSNNGIGREPVAVAEKLSVEAPITIFDETEVPEIVAALKRCGARVVS
jgi:predicted ABC-type ATPase